MQLDANQDLKTLIEQAVAGAYARTGFIAGSLRNRAFSTGNATLYTSPTNGMTLIVGAAILQARTSGIFQASVTTSFTGGTAAGTFTYSVTTQTVATVPTFANNTKVGPGAAGTGVEATLTTGAFVSNAAGGIVVTGGGGALTQYSTGTQVLPTAGTTAHFAWSNKIHNSISATVETPFTIGNAVLLLLSLNTSAAVVPSGFAIELEEQP